ncbi:MAG: MBG domain-containing protein, partial [Planctomycetota bacterium]
MPLKVVPRVPTKPVRNIYKGMESLESRALMAANVLTDLPDYLPGETAIISAWNDSESGADFTAGETVLFQVTRTDGLNDLPNGNLPWFVTDGVGGFDGYFVDSDNDGSNDYGVFPDTDGTVNAALGTTWFVEEQYFKSTLLLTATGQSSSAVATWEFTDGGSFSVSPGDDTLSVNVAAGSNANLANVTLTVPKNNGLQTPTIAFSGAPTGVTITYSALSDSDAANAVGTVNTGGSRDNDQTIVYRINLASTTSVSPGTYPIRATFAASTGTINTPNNQWDFNLVIPAADGSGSLGVGTQSGTATYGGTTENVTFAIDATRQSNGNFSGTYSVSGLPTGVTGSFNPTSFTSTGSNAFTDSVLTLTVPSTVSAGSYPFTVILTNTNNSTFVQSFGTLLVQRAGLTIAANNLTKTYGDTLTLDDTTPGDFAVTGLSNSDTVTSVILTSSGTDATANVGSYSIVPSAAIGSGLSNYDITYTDGSLSVQKRSVTISADAKSKTYADGNPTLTATEGNTVAGAAALNYSLATNAGQFSDVGSYAISITLGSNPNYSVTTTAGSLTVGQRSVSVTADAKSKTYADANPTLTATEGNTVAGAAALDYTLATTADQFSDVGSYAI